MFDELLAIVYEKYLELAKNVETDFNEKHKNQHFFCSDDIEEIILEHNFVIKIYIVKFYHPQQQTIEFMSYLNNQNRVILSINEIKEVAEANTEYILNISKYDFSISLAKLLDKYHTEKVYNKKLNEISDYIKNNSNFEEALTQNPVFK